MENKSAEQRLQLLFQTPIILLLPLSCLGLVVGTTFVDFVTVLGIVARNGIMVLSHYRYLQVVENVPFGRELILRGAEDVLKFLDLTLADKPLPG